MININPFLFKVSVLLLGIFSSSFPAQQKVLSLDEAQELALEHSYQLKTDSVALKLAHNQSERILEKRLPEVSLNSSFLRLSDNITPFVVAFPTGNVTLNPQILNQSFNAIQARQLIWGGGRVSKAKEIAELEKNAAEFELLNSQENIRFQIKTLYYNLYSVKKTKSVLQANINLLENQKKDVSNFVKQGILLENELLKIDLAVTQLKTNLSDLDNTITFLKNNLSIFTGVPNVDIEESLPVVSSGPLNFQGFADLALQRRYDLKGMQIREQQLETGVSLAKRNYLPTLSGIASFNYDQPNMRLFPNQEIFTGTWYAGLSLNWNLSGLYTNSFAVKESRLLLEKMKVNISKAKEGIQIQIHEAYNNYLNALEKVTLAEKTLAQAKENFRVEQNRFRVNNISTTDFLSANTLLVNAEIALYTAQANADLAYHKLMKSTL